MVSRPENSESTDELSAEFERLKRSEAFEWAVQEFGFEPNTAKPQPGVEDLQKWLLSFDKGITVDGRLGPQTLRAIEAAYDETVLAEPAEVKSKAASIDFGTRETGASARQQRSTDQVVPPQSQQAPPGSSPAEAPAPPPERPAEPQPEQPPEREAETPETSETPETGEEEVSVSPVALSDRAIDNLKDDKLGFEPYVRAVTEFILAEQTEPPLTIAIHAPWGRGKTSFMKLIDAQLKEDAPKTTLRVATTWFNPWKFSEPEQVWGAFIAKVTRCLRDGLTPSQGLRFRFKRLKTKLHRHADIPFMLRLFIALAFFYIVGSLAFMEWAGVQNAILEDQKLLKAFITAANDSSHGLFGYALLGLIGILAVIYAYVTFSDKLGLNLLDYVEKTDFKDKIGTLSQFEHEMSKLSEAAPSDLKVIVFIDDLDRCRGKVLGEIIEALQLADVSDSCIFVLGMDMRRVASAIESDREDLIHSVDSPTTHFEHGSGYKFLEKIIQARVSLPSYNTGNMRALVRAAVGAEKTRSRNLSTKGQPPAGAERTGTKPADSGDTAEQRSGESLLSATVRAARKLAGSARETPKDSDAVVNIAADYGSRHFENPRRAKRFVNSFRLQAYLAGQLRATPESKNTPEDEKRLPSVLKPADKYLDRLARFLVLSERWPAVVNHMIEAKKGADILKAPRHKGTSPSVAVEIKNLEGKDGKRLADLLLGPKEADPLSAEDVRSLAEWCGFTYYRSAKAPEATT